MLHLSISVELQVAQCAYRFRWCGAFNYIGRKRTLAFLDSLTARRFPNICWRFASGKIRILQKVCDGAESQEDEGVYGLAFVCESDVTADYFELGLSTNVSMDVSDNGTCLRQPKTPRLPRLGE